MRVLENKKNVFGYNVEEIEETRQGNEISRRTFLKRSAYSAPVLMTMGQLVKPQSLHAEYTGDGCADPDWLGCNQ